MLGRLRARKREDAAAPCYSIFFRDNIRQSRAKTRPILSHTVHDKISCSKSITRISSFIRDGSRVGFSYPLPPSLPIYQKYVIKPSRGSGCPFRNRSLCRRPRCIHHHLQRNTRHSGQCLQRTTGARTVEAEFTSRSVCFK